MSGFVRLSVLFVIGALLGIWTFIEPWVIRYPFGGARHQWSASMWSNVWAGAIVTAVSLIALAITVGAGLHAVAAAQAPGSEDPTP